MKVPINCPICGLPLLNTFPPKEVGMLKVTKSCNKKVNHAIAMMVENEEVVSLSIGINPTNQLQATWMFRLNQIWVWESPTNGKAATILPFFEPDLSNYKKLVEKIKTYLIFS